MNERIGVERRLSRLRKLDAPGLQGEYEALYGKPVPKRLDRTLLEAAIGYRLQKTLIAQLRHRMLQALEAGEAIILAIAAPNDQSVLIRQWRGHCHVVTVMDDGVTYQGQMYPSLSAVAQQITGKPGQAERLFRIETTKSQLRTGKAHAI